MGSVVVGGRRERCDVAGEQESEGRIREEGVRGDRDAK